MFQDFLSVCKNLPEAEVQIWYNMDLNSEYSLQNYYKIKFSRISLLSCSVHDKKGLMGKIEMFYLNTIEHLFLLVEQLDKV